MSNIGFLIFRTIHKSLKIKICVTAGTLGGRPAAGTGGVGSSVGGVGGSSGGMASGAAGTGASGLRENPQKSRCFLDFLILRKIKKISFLTSETYLIGFAPKFHVDCPFATIIF